MSSPEEEGFDGENEFIDENEGFDEEDTENMNEMEDDEDAPAAAAAATEPQENEDEMMDNEDEDMDAANAFKNASEKAAEDNEEKDAEGRVPVKERITSPYLTKYERARLLGTRALQISQNAPLMVDPKEETDPLRIAQMELQEKKIPLIVRRYLPDGKHYEDWTIDELMFDYDPLK